MRLFEPQSAGRAILLREAMGMRRVLFLVSDFAPLTSVGRIRTQKMCKFLPQFGWRASVLTFEPPAGTLTDSALLAEVPPDTPVYRVRCPQPIEAPVQWASRIVHRLHRGRPSANAIAEPSPDGNGTGAGLPTTPGWLNGVSRAIDLIKSALTRRVMIPDEGMPGIPAMVRAAVEIVRRDRIDLLVSSVPGFSPWLAAVLAGRRTGVPVVVDYRDLWHQDVLRNWVGPLRARFELMLERWALSRAQAVVTASEGKTRFVRGLDRRPAGKPYATIYNGFDRDDLTGVEPSRVPRDAGRLLLLYTGRLYKHRRIDPLLESVGRLIGRGQVRADELRVRVLGLIEARQRVRIDRIVQRFGLDDVVELGGYVTRRESLAQQLGADALVLIVDPGETSDGVLPGKITEYMGLGRFVLAVCPPGEARSMLERYGHAAWASGDKPARLDAALSGLVGRWRRNPGSVSRRLFDAQVATRRDNAADLAELLGQVVPAHAERRAECWAARRVREACGVG